MQGLPIHHTQAVDMHRCSKVTFADVFGWVPWRKQLICMLANAEEEVSKLKATKKYGMKNQQLWWNGHTFFFLAAIVAWYLGFCFATELTVMCVIR
uniref:Uncharacterized protein n=1 Tax=Arundo donax TaxID=35708 RepID=A0A0A9DL52_ARUDO